MKITPEYLHAGNAVFTVSNPNGTTFYVRVQLGRPRAGMPKPYWITVSDHDAPLKEYQYVGMMLDNGRIATTRTSRFRHGELMYNIVAWALKCIWVDKLPAGYAIEWAGRCGKCGRKVTEHIDGFGPECHRSIHNVSYDPASAYSRTMRYVAGPIYQDCR
jgi:hypothetical protein